MESQTSRSSPLPPLESRPVTSCCQYDQSVPLSSTDLSSTRAAPSSQSGSILSLPSINTSTPNQEAISVLSSTPDSKVAACSSYPGEQTKRSLNSHQALLRAGPKVSSASAVGVGAIITSYKLTTKLVPFSDHDKLSQTFSNDSNKVAGSEEHQVLHERDIGVQRGIDDGMNCVDQDDSLHSPGINSGELDRRLGMTEEYQRTTSPTTRRPEFRQTQSDGGKSSNSSRSILSLMNTAGTIAAPPMLRADSGGSGSTASLSPMSEESFCLSEGGGSCESAFTTPGPSPYRKAFDLEDKETVARSKVEGSSRERNSTDSVSLHVKEGSPRSIKGGRACSSSSASRPRHVRRSTFGRDSTTGKWLYSPNSTPHSSRSASANISNVLSPNSSVFGAVTVDSTQIQQFTLPLSLRALVDPKKDSRTSSGTWRETFNLASVAGQDEHPLNLEGGISPKRVTFGIAGISEMVSSLEGSKLWNIRDSDQGLGEGRQRGQNCASLDSSLRIESTADVASQSARPLQDQPLNTSRISSASFNSITASEETQQQVRAELDTQSQIPPAYLRSPSRTREGKLIRASRETHRRAQDYGKIEDSKMLRPTSSEGRTPAGPDSSRSDGQARPGQEDDSVQASPRIPISHHTTIVSSVSKAESEVDVYHLPAVAIAARALVAQSPSTSTFHPSSPTISFSSAFLSIASFVHPDTVSSPSFSLTREQLSRGKSDRDVANSSEVKDSCVLNDIEFPPAPSSCQDGSFSGEHQVERAIPDSFTPLKVRAVSASSAFDGLGGFSPYPTSSGPVSNGIVSGSLSQPSPRGKFTSKFKGGNLDLGLRTASRRSPTDFGQAVNGAIGSEESGSLSTSACTEAQAQNTAFRKPSDSNKSDRKQLRALQQSLGSGRSVSDTAFSAFHIPSTGQPDGSEKMPDAKQRLELQSKVSQLSSPSKTSFSSSGSARHISARALASKLIVGESVSKGGNSKCSNYFLAVSNPKFAGAVSSASRPDTDGEESDGGYCSETPVPTPEGSTPTMLINDPIETAMSNGLAITPPLESTSASSTPVQAHFPMFATQVVAAAKFRVEPRQSKRDSYPFGLARPSNADPPSPLELPNLLLQSITSSQSDGLSVQSKDCSAALLVKPEETEWGEEKIKALEKGWKRRTVAGVVEGSLTAYSPHAALLSDKRESQTPKGPSVLKRFSTPSSIFADTARRQAEAALLEGATEARASNRHKSWAPERFGEAPKTSIKGRPDRKFSGEEARAALNSRKILRPVEEESREIKFERSGDSSSSSSISSCRHSVQSPKPPRPPKSALRLITSPEGVDSLLSSVALDTTLSQASPSTYVPIPPSLRVHFSKAAAASAKKKRQSLPAQISLTSSPTQLKALTPRSASRPTFQTEDTQTSETTFANLDSELLERCEPKGDHSTSGGFSLGLGLNVNSGVKAERTHSRIPSLVANRAASAENLKESLLFSHSLASGLINPLHSPLAQAAVSSLNSPTSKAFAQAQLPHSVLLASADLEKEMEKLAPYRVTPRPEDRETSR